MNRRINHAHAARSTWQPARVAHLTATPPRQPPTIPPRGALSHGRVIGMAATAGIAALIVDIFVL